MKLFERTRIGSMELKNRIAMAPMGTAGLMDADFGYSRRLIDFYAARAKGGAGMIITGAAVVNTRFEGGIAHTLPRLTGPEHVSRLAELCEAMHHHGAKLVLQLSAGFGRINHVLGNPIPLISASAVPCLRNHHVMTRELTKDEIAEIVMSFGISAAMAAAAGVDAIEIQGYGGYLIDQFQTALWNKRTDEYGGDLDGRMRFTNELIAAARNMAGGRLPIIYKFTPDHYIPGGRRVEEGLEIARRLEKAGIDALHVDGGCYEVWNRVIPSAYEAPACQIDLAAAVRQVVGIPVIAHGKLGDPEIARRVLAESKADFIALGRPLLADPDWPNKVRRGLTDEIRPCIACNETCLGKHFSLACTVNPQTGMERDYAPTPISKKKSVLVVGGGPGGLEAARVAAARGCDVTLWEKRDRLGGKLHVAAVPDFKRDLRPLIRWMAAQIEKAGVGVEYGKLATADAIARFNPDAVILATGSRGELPKIPGIERANVLTTVDLLEGKPVKERVLVVGGGSCGCEAAAYLAARGKKPIVVEMADRVVPEGKTANTRLAVKALLAQYKVEVMTSTRLVELTDGGAVVERHGTREELQADSVVMATGYLRDTSLRDTLEEAGVEVIAVGDCLAPRTIGEAIWEGFHAARVLE